MLIWLFLIPVLAAALIGLAHFPARGLSRLSATLTLVMGIAAVATYDACPEYWSFGISGKTLQFTLAPALAKVMVLLTVLVTFSSVFGMKAPEGAAKSWSVSTLLISAGATGAFMSDCIVSFFAFHELALIPTFVMIGFYGRGDRRSIAWKITLYLGAASMFLLAGLLLLGNDMGYAFSNISQSVARGQELSYPCLTTGLLLVGFGTLVSLFPFHSWAAPAYASAPAPIAMMHAGVLKKFGLYGLFMIAPALGTQVSAFACWNELLLIFLLGNVIWVGYVTVNQKRLDMLLGNSSVMHMGYIFLAFAAYVACGGNNEWAIRGAALLMLGHGLSIALLFLLASRIEDKTGTLEISALGGLASKLPKLGFLFGLAAMASIGLPLLANFPGELTVFFSGFAGWHPSDGLLALGSVQVATIIALWGLVISAVYMLRAFRNIFEGVTSRAFDRAVCMGKCRFCELAAAIFLALCLVFFGLFPFIVTGFFS